MKYTPQQQQQQPCVFVVIQTKQINPVLLLSFLRLMLMAEKFYFKIHNFNTINNKLKKKKFKHIIFYFFNLLLY